MNEVVYHSNYQIENNYFWFLSRNSIVKNIFETLCNKDKKISNSKVLDIGCGTGGFAINLQNQGYEVYCLDTEPIALDYCKKRGLTNLFNCYIDELKNKLKSEGKNENIEFSTAFALDVIEHIEDDAKAINDIYDLLPIGGYFVATVPAYKWLWSEHDIIHMHYRRYNINQFEKLLKSQCFHIKYSSYFNTFLFPAVVVKRFLDKLLNKKSNSPVDVVSDTTNSILKSIFDKEKKFLPNIKFPFGLSIIVIAQKLK